MVDISPMLREGMVDGMNGKWSSRRGVRVSAVALLTGRRPGFLSARLAGRGEIEMWKVCSIVLEFS